MPSTTDPKSSVNSGPGLAPIGTVPASALLNPTSGGGGGGGSSLASLVSWVGDGAWLDGTTNPATDVGSQLTKLITDLTNATATHAAANRISASSPTTATFADTTTATGSTIQALIENIITLLAGVNGAAKIGAQYTGTSFVDGYAPTAGSVLGILDFIVMTLGQQIFGSTASISGTAPNMVLTGITLPTTPAGLNLPFSLLSQNVTIYNSAHPGNVGTFPIIGVGSSSQLTLSNGSGLADAGGNITWYISTGSDRIGARVTQAKFADTQAAIGESVQALIEYVVAYLGATTGAGATGSAAISGNPNTLGAGSVHSQLTSLLGFANQVTSFTRTLTSSHTLDDGSSPDRVVVLNGSGSFNFTLTNPSLNTGRKILIVDTTGILATAPVTLVRFGSEKIAGTAANYSLRVPYGNWLISCDGTNWFIQQGATDFYNERVVGPSADSLDSAGYKDETVFLSSNALPFNFSLPDLTVTPSLGRGRRVYLIDQNGNLGVSPVLLVPVGSQTINGVNAPLVLNSPWATYLLTSDGNGWFVSVS